MSSKCAACGGQDFYMDEGHWTCHDCFQVSQNYRATTAEIEDVSHSYRQYVGRGAAGTTSKRSKEYGRHWTVLDAYTYVIQHQTQAMVNLGAKPEVKKLGLRVWATYLRETQRAFSTSAILPLQESYLRHRDMAVGDAHEPRVLPVRYRLSHRKGGFRLNEFEDDEEKIAPIASKGKKSDRTLRDQPDYLNIHNVTCLSYIALLFSNPGASPCTVTRWIQQGHLPYFRCQDLLPEDMKISSYDHALFRAVEVPSPEKVQKSTCALLRLLKIQKLPKVSMPHLIRDKIEFLHLPDEFLVYVMNLYHLHPLSLEYVIGRNKIVLPDFEMAAMAYIFFGLKSIFGLYDATELKLSNCTRELMRLHPQCDNLFVWNEWKSFIRKKCSKDVQEYLKKLDSSSRKHWDVVGELEELKRAHPIPQRSFFLHSKHKLKARQMETRQHLQRPFQDVLADLERLQSGAEWDDLPSPASIADTRGAAAQAGRGLGDLEAEAAARLRKSSLAHLLKPQEMLATLLSSGPVDERTRESVHNIMAELGKKRIYMRYRDQKSTLPVDLMSRESGHAWLLVLCSSVLCCPHSDLEKTVSKIEDLHLGKMRK